MNKLIKAYNDKYTKIGYPQTTLDIYYVYLFLQNKINEYQDDELRKMLEEVELPKPKTLKEMNLYIKCVDIINGISVNNEGKGYRSNRGGVSYRQFIFFDKENNRLEYKIDLSPK